MARTTSVAAKSPAPPSGSQDISILRAALELERRTVAAYIAGIPLLPARQATWAKAFLPEELSHVGELIGLLRAAGAAVPPAPGSYDIGDPRDAVGVLVLLASLEDLQLESYLLWMAHLSPGAARAGAGSILANDAQHAMALRAARGRRSLRSAFVIGSPGHPQRA